MCLFAENSAIPGLIPGAGRRPVAEDVKLSRRTQSFLPRKLKPKEKDSKFVMSSPARDRQLSALNHTVRGLQNKLSEKGKQLEEVSKENRLLNRLQRRQDREWSRIQRQEDELPQILQRHEQEARQHRMTFYGLTIPVSVSIGEGIT